MEVYIAGIGILYVFDSCDLDLDPMTFTFERDPYRLETYRICNVNSYVEAGYGRL